MLWSQPCGCHLLRLWLPVSSRGCGDGQPFGSYCTTQPLTPWGEQRGGGPSVWSPRPARVQGWAKDSCAVPGSRGPLHILALEDGEDPTPTAGVPQGSVSLSLSPVPSSTIPSLQTQLHRGCAAHPPLPQQPDRGFGLSAHRCRAGTG